MAEAGQARVISPYMRAIEEFRKSSQLSRLPGAKRQQSERGERYFFAAASPSVLGSYTLRFTCQKV